MSNRVCDIARDLMPLAVDDAASAASKAFVEEHAAMCPDCARIYREMRAVQPAAPAPDESDRAFGRSVLRIRKKRRIAAVLTALLVVAIFATAGAIGYNAYVPHFTSVAGTVPADELELRLARLPSGRVLVCAKALDESLRLGGESYSLDTEGGANSLSFTVTAFKPTFIRQWKPNWLIAGATTAFWLIDGQLYAVSRDMLPGEDGAALIEKPDSVSVIRYEGPDEAVTLYRDGDEIPLLGEEEFLALRDELMCDWYDLLPDEYAEAPAYAKAAAEVVRNGGESTDRVTVVSGGPTLFVPIDSTLSEPERPAP